ncbi:MAG: alpha/beta fold hydrolase [Solirubrobacteraceae bacterium]
MTALDRIARAPADALEFANVLLTTGDAVIGASPRDTVWTHRKTTLYRYRSDTRSPGIPILLVFALINRPDIFDLRPGSSLVEFLICEGFDVFLVDWGYPDEEDADTGFEDLICDELHWAVRETLRAAQADELTLMGWCMGATMCAAYCGLPTHGDTRSSPVRNLVLLTTPIDGRGSTYADWVGRHDFDLEAVADDWRVIPGSAIDIVNKMLKPVTNFITTYRRLAQSISDDKALRDAYQPMAKWVADTPDLPGRAWSEWIRWMYRDGTLVEGRVRLRGERVDLTRIDQNLLVITAKGDHIAPPAGTAPIFALATSEDVTHLDRPGGHIGLIAGSSARRELWPDLAAWLAKRSDV